MTVLLHVQAGVARWLASHPLGREEDLDADALVGCARVAVQQGLFDHLDGHTDDGRADQDEPRSVGRASVTLEGFNLHVAVRISADDDVARERLVRYCARPPFALHRLSVLPDGRIAYQLQHPRRNATHRILQPVELLARIAALIPPPRHPFLRYHGVLAPSSRWRSAIVPRGVRGTASPRPREAERPTAVAQPTAPRGSPDPPRPEPRPPDRAARPPPAPSRAPASPPMAGRAPFATITEAHHARVLDGPSSRPLPAWSGASCSAARSPRTCSRAPAAREGCAWSPRSRTPPKPPASSPPWPSAPSRARPARAPRTSTTTVPRTHPTIDAAASHREAPPPGDACCIGSPETVPWLEPNAERDRITLAM
ncbi:MAG: transposase [Myxococcales bacterium]|nr:transposase [Myxococcales bacterium]